MYKEQIKDLYIGKSKLVIRQNDKVIPDNFPVKSVFLPTGYTGNYPDYGNYGYLWRDPNTWGFDIDIKRPTHTLYITGIPKGAILDNFRLEEVIWSSYYEDEVKGYLFQAIPYDVKPKLIIDGGN